MLRTKYVFNLFLELPGHMPHGSPQVCELVRAFAMAEVLGGDAPDFWRKVQMRGHDWNGSRHVWYRHENEVIER